MLDVYKRIEKLSPEKMALLAELLSAKRNAADAPIKRRSKLDEYSMTSAQKRIWFLQNIDPKNSLYNIPAAIYLKGRLNIKALEESFALIQTRHQILRSHIITVNSEPKQLVDPQIILKIPVIDLEKELQKTSSVKIKEIIKEEFQKPFNLSFDKLLRTLLLKINADEHILLVSMHHIISDGWSIKILGEELSRFYKEFSEGTVISENDLLLQYFDYAEWQNNLITNKKLKLQEEYWIEKLKNMPAVLELPFDKPRHSAKGYEGKHFRFFIPKSLTNKIKILSRKKSVSIFMILLSAFEILLSKYSGQNDFGIGIPVANRNRKELEELIGLFVNTIVIRSDIKDSVTFENLLQKVSITSAEAFNNASYPFDVLIDKIQPERNINVNPLFQVMFDYQESPLNSIKIAGLEAELLDVERETSKMDLSLSVSEENWRLRVDVEYKTELYTQDSIKKLSVHFKNILDKCIKNPSIKINQINYLSAKEHERFLHEWNKGESKKIPIKIITTLLEEQANKSPDSTAIVFGSKSLTFRRLNEEANRIANFLITNNVSNEDVIGIFLNRSTEMITSLFGILKAGCAYLPLDTSYPRERLEYILNNSKTKIIISDNSLASKLNLLQQKIILLDQSKDLIARQPEIPPEIKIYPENLAYIIYTSGSTGVPKGVMISHRSVVNLAESLFSKIYKRINSESIKIVLDAPFIFDASVMEIFMLLYGISIHIVPEEMRTDLDALWNYIQQNKIDEVFLIPSQLKLILENGSLKEKYPSLITTGAEAIDIESWKALQNIENKIFLNMYGPTEGTVVSLISDINKSIKEPEIGRPLHNIRINVLDQNMNPVPLNVPGELHLSGECLSRGYSDDPGLTAEKFIPNPFAEKPGVVMYRTGDLVKWMPDGSIMFLNRIDDQVKVRGYRIELSEIESVLKLHPKIKDAKVIVNSDANDKLILAFYISNDKKEIDSNEIKIFLLASLPRYMIPSWFIKVDKFPLNHVGKVDKKTLLNLKINSFESSVIEHQPQNELELQLKEIWLDILRLKFINTRDNFFEIGGDSIKAAIFINRVREKLNIDVNVRAAFLYPTIYEFTRYLINEFKVKTSGEKKSDGNINQIKKSKKKYLPLSSAQERLWFLEQLEPGNPLYNISGAVNVKGKLNIEALRKSFAQIIKRHKILSTAQISVEGKVQQQVINDAEFIIEKFKIAENDQSSLQKFILDYTRKPFDLSKPPVLRACVIEIREDQNIILFSMHHIAGDGWSISILIKELSEFYNSNISNRKPRLKNLPIQYSDYAAWQRENLKGNLLKQQLQFWKNELKDSVSLIDLPVDHPRTRVKTYNGEIFKFELDDKTSAELMRIFKAEKITYFSGLLAVFQILFARYSHQTDFNIGIPVSNREDEQLENLIGIFINTLVIRSKLKPQTTFRELVHEVNKKSQYAFSNQDVPFEMLVDELNLERSLALTPLFQVMFAYQNTPKAELKLDGLDVELFEPDTKTAKYELTLFMSEEKGKFIGQLEYNSDLYEQSTIQRMCSHFQSLAKRVTEETDTDIFKIQYLNENEITDLLNKNSLNHKEVEFISELNKGIEANPKTIHKLFEKQAALTPDIIAVSYYQNYLTYKQLDKKANKLARYLINHGLETENVVGLLFNRSLEMIVSLFAVLKAGCAYLPLDVSYPKERLEYIIEKSEAKFILTESSHYAILENVNTNKIFIDKQRLKIETLQDTAPKVKVRPENLAYIIFTSGSTGVPKGVMITHSSVINLTENLYRKIYKDLNIKNPKIVLNAPIMFDASVQQIMMLLYGISLYLINEDMRMDLNSFSGYLQKYEIDGIDCVPSQLKILIENGLLEKKYPSIFLPGGEAIDAATWESLINAENKFVFNMYGPTECTVDSIVCQIDKKIKTPSIGRPLGNIEVYILDENLNLAPQNVSGEIYLGGACLARGYYNQPDLTAEKFIPNPFNQSPGRLLYKSGDTGKYLKDGNIAFLGRRDNQIKLHGFRIELEEIENVLRKYHNIKDVKVVNKSESNGSVRLVAFYSSRKNENIEKEILIAHLRKSLPYYMIPQFFIKVDEFPFTENGKVDVKILRKMDYNFEVVQKEKIIPQTELELKLAEIWSEVLKAKEIGVEDNFFELGGDSILSIQVAAKANKNNIPITTKNIFQFPTIKQLVENIDLKLPENLTSVTEGEIPLTPIQHSLFAQKLENVNHFNQSVLLELQEKSDIIILGNAIKYVINYHDAFRIRFKEIDNKWKQYYSDQNSEEVEIKYFDFSSQKENISSLINGEAEKLQEKLNIEAGPLYQIAYVRVPDSENDKLIFIIHHLIIDGISWRILLDDIQTAYEALKQNEEIFLSSKGNSFKDWALLLNNKYKILAENSSEYWLKLTNIHESNLQADFLNGDNIESSTAEIVTKLNEEETKLLIEYDKNSSIKNLQSILLFASAKAFQNYSGKKSVVFALEGHGREAGAENVNINRTIGWFTSLFPFKVDLQTNSIISEEIKAIKKQLQNIPMNGLSYGVIKYLREDDVSQKLRMIPNPEISFNYLGKFQEENNSAFSIAEFGLRNERAPLNKRQFKIDISAIIAENKLIIRWFFSKKLFSEATIERLSENLIEILRNIILQTEADKIEKIEDDNLTEDDITNIIYELNED